MVCDNSHHTVHTHKVFHQYVSACVTLEVEEWWQCGCIGNIWNYALQHFCEFQDGPSNYTLLRILCHSTDNWRASLWCGLARVAGSRLRCEFGFCLRFLPGLESGKFLNRICNWTFSSFQFLLDRGNWPNVQSDCQQFWTWEGNLTKLAKISQNFAP